MADGIYNTDYTGLKWSNIDKFWKIYSKYNFIADVCNHNQIVNDETIENHFLCNIIGNKSLKCTLLHPCDPTTGMVMANTKYQWQCVQTMAARLILWPSADCLTLIPIWISNYMPSKVWDEITHSFPNFTGATVELWEWISNFIPHVIKDVLIHAEITVNPC